MEKAEMVLSIIGDTIGNIFGSNEPHEDETMTPCFRPGIIFDVGFVWVQFVRQCLISGAVLQWHGKINSNKDDLIKRSKQSALAISLERERAEKEMALCKESIVVQIFTNIRKLISNQFEKYQSRNEIAQINSKYCDDFK